MRASRRAPNMALNPSEVPMRTLTAVAFAALLLSSCGEKQAQEIRDRAADVVRSIEQATQDERRELRERLEGSLSQLRDEAEQLGRLAAERGDEAREGVEEFLEQFEERSAEARRRLDGLRDTGAEKWERLKSEAHEALNRARSSYEEAMRRF